MEPGIDFTIEPFKPHKQGPRSDKGRTHNYHRFAKSGNKLSIAYHNEERGFAEALDQIRRKERNANSL